MNNSTNSSMVASPATTTTMNVSGTGTAAATDDDWTEFCDRHARAAAANFANAFSAYVNIDLTEQAKANLSYRDFLRKFVEIFCDQFENEYAMRTAISPSSLDANRQITGDGHSSNQNNRPHRASSHDDFSDYSEHDGDVVSPKPAHKPFFRRLSFKGFKKGINFIHKQHSDEVVLSDSRKSDKHKAKLSKIVVECRKEGAVNAMIIESTDVPQKFEKCRLALVKASAGYMLEFYSSSKSKPRHGIFCSSITEARETTALEMPDHENTFVLKTLEKEFIIEAKDASDMKSWLATIKYCMRNTYAITNPMGGSLSDSIMGESAMHGSTSMNIESGERMRANSASKSMRSTVDHVDGDGNPPELPPRLRAASNSNLELCSSQQEIEQIPGAESEVDHSNSLLEYPWFHQMLPRSEAAQLVLHNSAGHGTFLVRQSETRKGEYVLTFNFLKKAKHLRMTLNETGKCRVQHLNFNGICEMLEHFRENPIPLETGSSTDVKLTDYVVRQKQPVVPAPGASNTNAQPQQQPVERRPAAAPEPREVKLYFGEISMRMESLERLEEEHHQQQLQQQQFNSSDEEQAGAMSSRAVQNAYSFL